MASGRAGHYPPHRHKCGGEPGLTSDPSIGTHGRTGRHWDMKDCFISQVRTITLCTLGHMLSSISSCVHRHSCLQLRVTLCERADFEFRRNLLQHVVGVVVHELRRRIRANVLEQNLATTRVLVQEFGHVVDVALDGDPGRLVCARVSNLDFPTPSGGASRPYIPELCFFTSSSVMLFDMVRDKV